MVKDGILPYGGDDPAHHSDQNRDQDTDSRQLKGSGKTLHDISCDRHFGRVGCAQISSEKDAFHVIDILHQKRLIQPIFFPKQLQVAM